jgi:hypothetical protein
MTEVHGEHAVSGRRHTERRPFRPDAVSAELLEPAGDIAVGTGSPTVH